MSDRMPPGCLSGQVIWGISNLDENHSATQKTPKWAQAEDISALLMPL